MALSDDQKVRVARALEVLEKRHGYGTEDLSAEVGRLKYWLRDMLALIEQLADP